MNFSTHTQNAEIAQKLIRYGNEMAFEGLLRGSTIGRQLDNLSDRLSTIGNLSGVQAEKELRHVLPTNSRHPE
jgi:hypothetical protein